MATNMSGPGTLIAPKHEQPAPAPVSAHVAATVAGPHPIHDVDATPALKAVPHNSGHPVVVVSPRFCVPHKTVLVMTDKPGLITDDRSDFDITDTHGRPYFKIEAASYKARDKRELLDITKEPVLLMRSKTVSVHKSWYLVDPGTGWKLAEIKPAFLSVEPSIKVYLKDGDKVEDFIIKGKFHPNYQAKNISIFQTVPGKKDRKIATVGTEIDPTYSTSFLMNFHGSPLNHDRKYFVTIEPGVDMAFVVALAMLCDEIYEDTPMPKSTDHHEDP